MFAGIAAARKLATSPLHLRDLLSQLGPYVSRGKGRGTPGRNYRAAYGWPNNHPHFGLKQQRKAKDRAQILSN